MPNEFSSSDRERFEDYARKLREWEDGPTTTNFEQLMAMGTQLPEPSSIADADMRTRLWEVLAGLAKLRVYLEHTDHLSDRELYAKLWNEILTQEVPAVEPFGDDCVNVLHPGDPGDDRIYLKYFADDEWRNHWINDNPAYEMPPSEEPPFNRDCLLPFAHCFGMPEAEEWLKANWGESAFASNRFGKTAAALEFVQQLYAAGATEIGIEQVMVLPSHDWAPYADALIVTLPEDPRRRREVFDLMRDVGRPDEDGGKSVEELLFDHGQSRIRLWWD